MDQTNSSSAANYSVLLKDPRGDNVKDIKRLLFYYLNRRNIVALCGAGCSKDQLGYGDWKKLASLSLEQLESTERNRLALYIDSPRDYINLRTIMSFVEIRKNPHAGREDFRKVIQEHFRQAHNKNRQANRFGATYQKLIELDIRRFVTTNFDFEIEMALDHEHKVGIDDLLPDKMSKSLRSELPEDLTPFRSGKSFSQVAECMEQLSCFPLGGNEASEYMVFHCHGRFDDIKSCILTEADYRSWYLKEDLPVKAFRQTMDLLFRSNPLLVIGYSLHDPELGQILRTVHAKRANDPTRSPLFLLLCFQGDNKDEQTDQCLALNEEYGAYVIPISVPGNNFEIATRNELDSLREGWQKWRQEIQEKPKVRTFMPKPARASTPACASTKYYHYLYPDLEQNETQLAETAAYGKLKQELLKLLETNNGVRCAVLVAKSGSGKTWSLQRFGLDLLGKNGPDETARRVFFWSSYYSHDLYNGLKRAIKFFMDNPPDHVQSDQIMPLFQQVLETEKDALLIFDGIEKLIKQSKHLANNDRLEAWGAIDRDVEKFFKMILENKGALVVLTSRILPQQFAEAVAKGSVKLLNCPPENQLDLERRSDLEKKSEYSSDPINAGDYYPLKVTSSECTWGALETLGDKERVSLCALLSGHLYSLCLIEKILLSLADDENARAEWLTAFIGKIADTPTDRRRERVVREALKASDRYKSRYKEDHDLLQRFIERVALFMSPVEQPALEVCLRLANEDRRSAVEPLELGYVITELRKRALLLEVQFNNIPAPGFTVHPLVQSYVRKHLHRSPFSVHPSRILPGYTSDFDLVDPGLGKDHAKQLFSSLCHLALDQAEMNKRASGASVRAAFGVLRSRFCSNTVSRWGNYHEYLQMVYELRDTAILSTNGRWSEAETIDDDREMYPGKEEPTTPPLYLSELAWLQNEAGLATYTEGNMLDAMFMRQQSSEINSLLDGKLPGFHRFQSYFNVGSVFIDLGNLGDAKRYLDDAMLIASAREDNGLRGRVLGYIGWLAYLQGNFEDADKDLRLALNLVKSNARAKSVFLTFLGQLLLTLGKDKEALELNENSRALAEGAHYPDLIAYSRLGIANVLRNQDDHVRAKREYETVLESAKRYGLRRLEAGVLTGLSNWAYRLHDSEAACRYALAALSLANEASLGLHQTECLLALGNALLLANQDKLGEAYLRTTLSLAREQRYFLLSTEAEAALRSAGATPERSYAEKE